MRKRILSMLIALILCFSSALFVLAGCDSEENSGTNTEQGGDEGSANGGASGGSTSGGTSGGASGGSSNGGVSGGSTSGGSSGGISGGTSGGSSSGGTSGGTSSGGSSDSSGDDNKPSTDLPSNEQGDIFDGEWEEISEVDFVELLNLIESNEKANQVNYDLYGARIEGEMLSTYQDDSMFIEWDIKCGAENGNYLMIAENSAGNKRGDRYYQHAYFYQGVLTEYIDSNIGTSDNELTVLENNHDGLDSAMERVFCTWHTAWHAFEKIGDVYRNFEASKFYVFEEDGLKKIKLLSYLTESTHEWIYVFDTSYNFMALSCYAEFNDNTGEEGTWQTRLVPYNEEIIIPEEEKSRINSYIDTL